MTFQGCGSGGWGKSLRSGLRRVEGSPAGCPRGVWLQCADRQEEVAGSQTSARGWGALLIFGGGLTPCEALVLASGCCPGPGAEGSRRESWGGGRVASAAAACDSAAPVPTRPLTGFSWGPREMQSIFPREPVWSCCWRHASFLGTLSPRCAVWSRPGVHASPRVPGWADVHREPPAAWPWAAPLGCPSRDY